MHLLKGHSEAQAGQVDAQDNYDRNTIELHICLQYELQPGPYCLGSDDRVQMRCAKRIK